MNNKKIGKSKIKSKKEDGAFPANNINHNTQA